MVWTKQLLRSSLLLVALWAAIYFFWRVRSGLYPFAISLMLAYLLNPAVNYLQHKGVKRLIAIIFIYVIVFASIIVVASWFVPLLINELESFGRDLPAITTRIEQLAEYWQEHYENSSLPTSLRIALDNSLVSTQNDLQRFVSGMVTGIISLLSYLIGIAISPILSFYILHDWHSIRKKTLKLIPPHWRREFMLITKDADKVLSGVIRGQLTVACIVGILVGIGLYFLHVKYALLIAIIAGMLDIIPYFGAFIGAAPAVMIALMNSPLLAGKVVILFFLIHQTEGAIIGPKILGESVGLHPLAVIFFLFVGGELWGILGMLLGVPVAALAKVLLQHLLRVLL